MSTLHEGDIRHRSSERHERSSRHRRRAARSHRYCRMVSLWCACATLVHEDAHFVCPSAPSGDMPRIRRCGSLAGVVALHLKCQTIQSLCTVYIYHVHALLSSRSCSVTYKSRGINAYRPTYQKKTEYVRSM